MARATIGRRTFLRAATAAAAGTLATAARAADPAAPTAPAAAARPATAAAAVVVRLLTYNIHHAVGTDDKLDLDRIAGVIRAADPDVVCLQEVDRNTPRSGRVDQAAELGRRTGLSAAFGKAIDFQGGEYGNAILSRHPLADVAVHPLPGKPGEEKRCLLTATAALPGGRVVRVAATHLNHRDAAERLAQAARVVAVLTGAPPPPKATNPAGSPATAPAATATVAVAPPAPLPPMPTLLAGDFNARPAAAEVAAVRAAFADVGDAPPGSAAAPVLSFPSGTPRSRIDYVFAAPPARWRPVSAAAVAEPVASDHRPVLSVVELRPG